MKARSIGLFICNVTIISLFLVPLAFMIDTPEARADSVTVNCSGTSGSPTAVTEADLAGDDVTFSDTGGDGYCVLDEAISAASVIIGTGVTITHTAADVDGVTISTTGNFTIQSGAYINADSKGCVSGAANGFGPNGSNICTISTAGYGTGGSAGTGGGGHGGTGGNGHLAGGTTYDSATNPVLFGSSGGGHGGGIGGNGGGLVILSISGAFTHNGSISVDGGANPVHSLGGGAGGSINVTAGSIAGDTGTFSADGGNGSLGAGSWGGGGGGGRIAINYTSSTFSFDSSDFTATGGTSSATAGSTGTVYVEDTDDNNVTIYHGFAYAADYSENSWTVDSSATNQYCDGASDATPSITATGAITMSGTLACTHASVTGFDTTAGTSITLSSFTFTMGGTDIWTMNDAVPVVLTSSTINSNVQWTNMTTLSIDAGSTINANSKGCASVGGTDGYGPDGSNVCAHQTAGYGNGGGAYGTQGGGHGGAGGAGSGLGGNGATYGSSTAPVLFGSSGGPNAVGPGGTGGGLIRLQTTGAFTHNGSISADGGIGDSTAQSGGGSGGSIYVTVGSIIENGGATGTFSADGGNGYDGTSDGGGGGGGRIAIEYGSDPDLLVAGLSAGVNAAGGAATGSAVAGSTGTLSTVQTVYLTSSTITDNSGYTNDATPVITITESGATPTHVAFSCDNTNWSSWLTYPDDDVVNDGDGPAFNITTDATNCSVTNELKTIYAKIKEDGVSESSVVSDTTTYDTSAPNVSGVSATNANATYGASVELTITVQFDENMAQTGAPQIELDFDGTDRQATYASLSTDTLSFTYTTVNGDNKTDLDYTGTGALTLNGGTITDLAGNTATLTLASPGAAGSLGANKDINVSTNQAPTVASVTAVQQSNGSVLITFIMDDADNDDTLQALVQYNVGGGNTKATMSETDGDTSATYGDPNVENDNSYQVGNAVAYITSSSGANTVSTIWNAPTDASGVDIANATITVTPYDGTAAGTPASSSNFALDTLAPTVSSASYKDTDADGTVDRVDIVFDENITVTSYNTSDWSFSEVGSINLNDTGASASTATILLTVTASANVTGGATDPTVLYTNNANRLTDAYGNAAATFGAPQTVTDGAAPQIKTAAYQDVDLDGKIDTISIDFTETLNAASVLAHDNITFSNVGDFTSAAFGSATVDLVGAVATVDITLGTEASVIDTAEGSGTIEITTVDGNAAFSLTDGTNENTTPKAETQISFLDEARPVFTSSTSADTNADGTVDRITVAFSETVDITDTNAAADGFDGITFSDSCTISNQDLSSNSVSSKAITVTGCTAGDTSITVDPTYVLAGTDMDIDDEASIPNEMTNGETVTGIDGAAPVFLTSTSADTNGDGTVDRITVTFSETVDITDTNAAADGFDGITFSDSCTISNQDLTSNSVSSKAITVTGCTASDTSITVDPTYVLAGTDMDIDDEAITPLEMANGETVTGTDGAAPVFLTSTSADTNADGTVDRITVTFSETVDITDTNAAADGFDGITFSDSCTISNQDLSSNSVSSKAITVTGCTASDTSITVDPTYVLAGTDMDIDDEAITPLEMTNGETVTGIDGAAPQIKTATYQDLDLDGKIDTFNIAFTETLDAASVLSQENLLLTVGDFTSAAFGSLGVDLVGAVSSVSVPLGTESTVFDTAEGSGTIAITSQDGVAAFSLTDGTNENTTPKAEAQVTFADGAAPQISSAAYQDVDLDGKIDTVSLDFSETLNAASVLSHENLSLTVGDFTSAAFGSAGVDLVGAVATVDITLGTEASVVDTYSTAAVALTSQDGVAAFSLTDGTNENTTPKAETQITFLDEAKPAIATSTPTDASVAQSRTNSVVYTFSEPMVGDTWVEGTEFDSTPNGSGWSGTWSGTGNTTMTLAHVNFLCVQSYSIAFTPAQITATNGETGYTELNNASTAPIGAAHTFTTASCDSGGGGGGGGGGSTTTTTTVEETTTDEEETTTDEEVVTDTDEDAEVPTTTGGEAYSPVTGELEEVTIVSAGDYIKSPYFPTVYYINNDLSRQPFMDAKTYFTYSDTFSDVKTVTDATLTTLDLGSVMLPNPGVVLVKIQSDPKTYAIDEGNVLRWITSEEVAIELYGSAWADYIIDIEPTFFNKFSVGSDIDEASDITVSSGMKTRVQISQ